MYIIGSDVVGQFLPFSYLNKVKWIYFHIKVKHQFVNIDSYSVVAQASPMIESSNRVGLCLKVLNYHEK